jgi:hypothetical protein
MLTTVLLLGCVAVVGTGVWLWAYSRGYEQGWYAAQPPPPLAHAVNPLRTAAQVLQEVAYWERAPRPKLEVYVLYENHVIACTTLGVQ